MNIRLGSVDAKKLSRLYVEQHHFPPEFLFMFSKRRNTRSSPIPQSALGKWFGCNNDILLYEGVFYRNYFSVVPVVPCVPCDFGGARSTSSVLSENLKHQNDVPSFCHSGHLSSIHPPPRMVCLLHKFGYDVFCVAENIRNHVKTNQWLFKWEMATQKPPLPMCPYCNG